jgi:sugar phosphate isomerase/epimerase
MRGKLGPGTTLSYCTNVHPGATLTETQTQLKRHASDVKRLVYPDEPMGVGLWIPYIPPKRPMPIALVAAVFKALLRTKDTELEALTRFLREAGLDAVTCNAFPYHDFHEEVVKHRVYEPSWASRMRTLQSTAAAHWMESLQTLPGSISISTVPIGWPSSSDDEVLAGAARNLRKMAEVMLNTAAQPERPLITIDLEPEPGCILDTSDDVIAFFDQHLPDDIHRRHIGVCHDICHAAVVYEDQAEALRKYAEAGINVNKVQVSSALDIDVESIGRESAIEHLRPFAEPRYLHQTSFLTEGHFELIEDLPEAIDRLQSGETPERIRVHFHVPIYLDQIGPLGTTQHEILPAIKAARELHDCKHFEVETYAWNVLPQEHQRNTLAEGIADELLWMLDLAERERLAELRPLKRPEGANGCSHG